MFKLFKFEKLNSTNRYALDNADNLPANSIIQAEVQTCGRGRFERKWISDKKENCYISFILKPDIKYIKNFPNLTQYLSLILCKELKKYGISSNIKWPNDVLVNGKKIAGILSEVLLKNNKIKAIILGLGVNLNLTEETLSEINIPATSLNLETGFKIDNKKFIEQLAKHFFEKYDNFLDKGFMEIKNEYLSFCDFLGKEIAIKNPEPVCLGIAFDICDDGALEVLSPDGGKKKIYSGDVIL